MLCWQRSIQGKKGERKVFVIQLLNQIYVIKLQYFSKWNLFNLMKLILMFAVKLYFFLPVFKAVNERLDLLIFKKGFFVRDKRYVQ